MSYVCNRELDCSGRALTNRDADAFGQRASFSEAKVEGGLVWSGDLPFGLGCRSLKKQVFTEQEQVRTEREFRTSTSCPNFWNLCSTPDFTHASVNSALKQAQYCPDAVILYSLPLFMNRKAQRNPLFTLHSKTLGIVLAFPTIYVLHSCLRFQWPSRSICTSHAQRDCWAALASFVPKAGLAGNRGQERSSVTSQKATRSRLWPFFSVPATES
jgi:hypothetical protein